MDGKIAANPPPRPLLPVSATVGGVPANVEYAGRARGEIAGVTQANVRIPNGLPLANRGANAVPATGTTIAIQP